MGRHVTCSKFVLLARLSLHRCSIVVVLGRVPLCLADWTCSVMHSIVSNVALVASVFHKALKHFITWVFIGKGTFLAVVLFTVVFVDGG